MRYFTAENPRVKKQVKGVKFILLLAACLPLATAGVSAFYIADHAFNDPNLETQYRLVMVAGAVFLAAFSGLALIKAIKAKV